MPWREEIDHGETCGVICRLSVLMLLATGLLPALPEALASPELVPVADMRHIKKFVCAVEVQTQGTAEAWHQWCRVD